MSEQAVIVQEMLEGFFAGKEVDLLVALSLLNVQPVKEAAPHLRIKIAGILLDQETVKHVRRKKGG